MTFHKARLVSKLLMVLALVAFTGFFFAPVFWYEEGWMFWKVLANPLDWRYWGFSGIASLITTGLLVLVSPFLGSVWARSRLTWILCLCISGLAMAGFWQWIAFAVRSYPGTYPPKPMDPNPGPYIRGICFLVAASFLSFTGLLFARRGKSAERVLAARNAAFFPPGPPESGEIPGETPDLGSESP